MKTKRISSDRGKQTVPVDPATLWDLSKRILFAVARKVGQSVRLKLEGHGRGEAEPEELVNDAFICLMEALPRFHPATAKFTTFVYGWRGAACGLSPAPRSTDSARSKCTGWTRRSERRAIIVASVLFALRQRQRKTPSNGSPSAAVDAIRRTLAASGSALD